MTIRGIIANSQRYIRIFDWALAALCLVWGIYIQSAWWIVGGVLGFGVAWFDPGTRIRKRFAFIKPAQVAATTARRTDKSQ